MSQERFPLFVTWKIGRDQRLRGEMIIMTTLPACTLPFLLRLGFIATMGVAADYDLGNYSLFGDKVQQYVNDLTQPQTP